MSSIFLIIKVSRFESNCEYQMSKNHRQKRKQRAKAKTTKAQNSATISLCTIVKNEEKYIAQCLQSVAGVVDEVVLVDTGSTDRTVKIAESMGAKVYHHPWQDSFSEARNYALQFVTSEWILQLDADEELEAEDKELLLRTIRTTKSDSIFVPIINFLPDGASSKFYYRRLFRRTKGHYEGIVHNQIVVEGTHTYAEVRIYHHGYNLSPEEMQSKYERSSKLLIKAIEENPDDVFSRFNLARIYRNQGKWEKCINEGMKGLQLNPKETLPSTYLMLLFDIAFSQLMLDNYDEAIRLCKEGLSYHPENVDLTFTLANALAKCNKFAQAVEEYRRFLNLVARMKADPTFNLTTLIVDTWGFENKALNNLGQCLAELGKYEEAESLLREAIANNPDEVLFYKGLSFVYLKQQHLTEAKRVLLNAVEREVEDDFVLFKIGEINRETGDYAGALEYYRKSIERGGEKAEVLNAQAYCNLALGKIDEAKNQYQRTLEIDPTHVGALFNMFRLANMQGDLPAMNDVKDRLLTVRIQDPYLFVQAGDLCVQHQHYPAAIEFYERYLKIQPADFIVLSNLASCYAQLGHYESAEIGYQAALSLNPEYDMAKRNLGKLQKSFSSNMVSV